MRLRLISLIITKSRFFMRLLADTQAFLWFIMGDARLASQWRSAIESSSNEPLVSVASLWEIAIKISIGKLEIDMTFEELIDAQIERNGFQLLPVSGVHLIELTKLPHPHRDPFDRLIIAQSKSERISIITTDPQFKKYDVTLLK